MSILIPYVFLFVVENTLNVSLVIIIELKSRNTNDERHKCHNVEPMDFVLVIMVLFYHQEQVGGHKQRHRNVSCPHGYVHSKDKHMNFLELYHFIL